MMRDFIKAAQVVRRLIKVRDSERIRHVPQRPDQRQERRLPGAVLPDQQRQRGKAHSLLFPKAAEVLKCYRVHVRNSRIIVYGTLIPMFIIGIVPTSGRSPLTYQWTGQTWQSRQGRRVWKDVVPRIRRPGCKLRSRQRIEDDRCYDVFKVPHPVQAHGMTICDNRLWYADDRGPIGWLSVSMDPGFGQCYYSRISGWRDSRMDNRIPK